MLYLEKLERHQAQDSMKLKIRRVEYNILSKERARWNSRVVYQAQAITRLIHQQSKIRVHHTRYLGQQEQV
jgi:hypothetical protein